MIGERFVPGEYISIARRKGNDWYIGSITNWNARTLSIPLSFLASGNYTAKIYSDAADAITNPKHTSITRLSVNNKTLLQAKLVPGGGYAVRITKTK